MITINVVGDYINGSVNGQQFAVAFDELKYQQMLVLKKRADVAKDLEELKVVVDEFTPLTQESYKELVESKSPYLVVNKHTNKFFLKYGNKVSSIPVPTVIVDKIIKAVEKNLDITPLVKCWVRYLRNPVLKEAGFPAAKMKKFAEYISAPFVNQQLKEKLMKDNGVADEVAHAMATTSQVSITQEGILVGYKVSNEIREKFVLDEETEEVKKKSRYTKSVDPDTGLVSYAEPEVMEDRLFQPACMGTGGDEFACFRIGETPDDKSYGHFIRVGRVHMLKDWAQVDCNDHHTAVPGLHVGGLNYIRGFQGNPLAITHNVFIDPMHIGAIVGLGDGNDGAMRVKQYFVYGSFAGVNKTLYHSSEYAKVTDAEYEDMIKAAVETTAMKQKEIQEQLGEAEALLIATADSSDGAKLMVADDVFDQK